MKNPLIKITFLSIVLTLAGVTNSSWAGPYVYVSNQSDSTVFEIDVNTQALQGNYPVGNTPSYLTATPDGDTVFVSNQGDGTVTVIDTASGNVIATLVTGGFPRGLAVTPDQAHLYVARPADSPDPDVVLVYRTSDLALISTINMPASPRGIAITPDGKHVYASQIFDDSVAVIATASNTVIDTIAGVPGSTAGRLAVQPGGDFVYVTGYDFAGGFLTVIDTATRSVVDSIGTGSDADSLAFTPDGAYLYVTNRLSHLVTVIDTATNMEILVGSPVAVGTFPAGVAVSPDGASVFVANAGDNTLSVIDTATNTTNTTVVVGNGPSDVASPTLNLPPVANAGSDSSAETRELVMLDGSGSSDDNTATSSLEFAWQFTDKPGGSLAALDDPASDMPTFVPDLDGTYMIELVVADEAGVTSAPDIVVISTTLNLPPSADAGTDQLVYVGQNAVLDGTASQDPENDPLTYTWSLDSAPAGSAAGLVGNATPMPSITPDIEGTYQVSLAVSDPLGPGALTDSVEITATLAEEFAETRIVEADTVIDSLPPEDVTTRGNANALKQFLRQAAAALMRGDVDKAIDSLEKAIERTDGCPLRGSPDTDGMERDWITDCAAQQELYELLVDALAALGS